MNAAMTGSVASVALSGSHVFSKRTAAAVEIVAGHGVKGDAHAGSSVQHLSRVGSDPSQPNLRQVHLLHAELLDALAEEGFDVAPGQLGENILTRGIALLDLPPQTTLCIGPVELEVTGLRNPCAQIETFRPELLKRLARKRADGSVERLAGIMCVARIGGVVRPGDTITVRLPTVETGPLLPV